MRPVGRRLGAGACRTPRSASVDGAKNVPMNARFGSAEVDLDLSPQRQPGAGTRGISILRCEIRSGGQQGYDAIAIRVRHPLTIGRKDA